MGQCFIDNAFWCAIHKKSSHCTFNLPVSEMPDKQSTRIWFTIPQQLQFVSPLFCCEELILPNWKILSWLKYWVAPWDTHCVNQWWPWASSSHNTFERAKQIDFHRSEKCLSLISRPPRFICHGPVMKQQFDLGDVARESWVQFSARRLYLLFTIETNSIMSLSALSFGLHNTKRYTIVEGVLHKSARQNPWTRNEKWRYKIHTN